MKKDEFENWLKLNKYASDTVASRLSNVSRINEVYDIDDYYASGTIDELLDLFKYSKQDCKEGLEPRADIVIQGDYYKGVSSLHSALKLYISFLDKTGILQPCASSAVTSSARFIGSLKEFNNFIGPFFCKKVQQFTKKERNNCKGICEYCHNKLVLQSAHRKGEERTQIIKRILDENYRQAGSLLYDVPLQEFTQKFKDAHFPISDHIFFLCENCHTKYDNFKTLTDTMIKAERNK